MFLGTITVATSTASTNIPIVTELNTNKKVVNNTSSNVLELLKAGVYNIDGWLTITGVTGDVSINFLANGNIKRTITVSIEATTDIVAIPIVDAVRALLASYPNTANVSIQTNTAGLTINGLVRVEYLQ